MMMTRVVFATLLVQFHHVFVQGCNLSGFWSGGVGSSCGMPSTDQYLLSGTAAEWTAILEAGAGWGNGTGHVSPDNVTTILVLDSGLTLRGKMAHCTCIIWDNGSFWVRLALGGITHVHLIAMNHLIIMEQSGKCSLFT